MNSAFGMHCFPDISADSTGIAWHLIESCEDGETIMSTPRADLRARFVRQRGDRE
jgi:hypothetical protein